MSFYWTFSSHFITHSLFLPSWIPFIHSFISKQTEVDTPPHHTTHLFISLLGNKSNVSANLVRRRNKIQIPFWVGDFVKRVGIKESHLIQLNWPRTQRSKANPIRFQIKPFLSLKTTNKPKSNIYAQKSKAKTMQTITSLLKFYKNWTNSKRLDDFQ